MVAVSVQSASAGDITSQKTSADQSVLKIHVHEASAGTQFIDLGPQGAGFGDELVGANVLTDHGKKVGTDTFICTTVSADGASLQCTVVYSLKGGRVTGQGFAKIAGKQPLFDERFAVTGGTRAYATARGEVRVVQTNQTSAELYLKLRR